MKAPPTCHKCGGPIQAAALNPKVMWCTVCATELTPTGGPLVIQPRPNMSVQESQTAQSMQPPEELGRQLQEMESIANLPAVLNMPKKFHVQIGNVSFSATDKVELDIAGTKVVIT